MTQGVAARKYNYHFVYSATVLTSFEFYFLFLCQLPPAILLTTVKLYNRLRRVCFRYGWSTDVLRLMAAIRPEHLLCLKPVLNWANVCSPNILWTVQRTMICFLIELLVHRKWFGQFEEFTCSQLACNGMQASAWTHDRRASDNMIKNVG